MLGRQLGFALFTLLIVATIFVAHGHAETMTPQELIDAGQINDDLKTAWNRKCMFHMTRECAEERSKIVWEEKFYNISGPIRCKVTSVLNASALEGSNENMGFVNQVDLGIPKEINCRTDAGNRIHIDALNAGCNGPFRDVESRIETNNSTKQNPFAVQRQTYKSIHSQENLHLCVQEPVFVDDVITVETDSALVNAGPGEGTGNTDEHIPVQLLMGGEFGNPVTVKVMK